MHKLSVLKQHFVFRKSQLGPNLLGKIHVYFNAWKKSVAGNFIFI